MPDKFEKKIDKHYSYKCGEDIDTNGKRNIGWYVVCEEHEPGKTPPFGQRSFDIVRYVSKSEAQRQVQELTAEELERRGAVEAEYPDVKAIADAAKKETSTRRLAQLQTEKADLESRIIKIGEEMAKHQSVVDN